MSKHHALAVALFTVIFYVCSAHAAIEQIEFTAAEGYTHGGNLGPSSADWYGQGSGQNVLDTSGTGTVTLDPDSPDTRAVYKTGISQGSSPMTVSVDFQFTEAATSGSGEVMTLLVSKKNAVSIDLFASLRRIGSDSYELYLTNVGGSPLTSPAIDDDLLGFNGTLGDVSDALSFSLSMERGSDENDWIFTMALHNIDMSSTIAHFATTNAISSTTFYNNAKLFVGFSSAETEAATGTGSRILERFGSGLGDPNPGGGGSETGPLISGWEQFVTNFNLSGSLTADADSDGQFDVVEFAHGGDPTNAADLAILPRFTSTNGAMGFVSLETTNSYPGIPYIPEWTDHLATGEWNKVWSLTTNQPASRPGYREIYRYVEADASEELFFRTRLARKSNRPNILFIVADDLGYADVSFNNSHPSGPDLLTPELDNLATNGMIFTSAYVTHPFCGPSRMGLLAGRYPHEFGAPYNLPDSDSSYYVDQGIPESETLFSTVLQDAGYRTGLMGKWHLGQQPEHHPNARGFDEFWGFLGGGKYYNPATLKPQGPSGLIVDYKTWPEHNGEEVEPTDWMTDWLSEKGSDFIHASATNSQPFFLFMSYNAPHTPLEAKPSDYQAVGDALLNPVVEQRHKYLALVYALDRGIGELVQALKDSGQYENTLIIFLSDNGGRLQFGASNHPLRGEKNDVMDGGIRVPMFMHWPNVLSAGETTDDPVTALDFYPTFAGLADASIPMDKDLDGRDIWSAVLANSPPHAGDPIYSVRYQVGFEPNGTTLVGIRKDNWKAVRWYGTWKLFNFDLPGHISENLYYEKFGSGPNYDLASTHPDILSNLVFEAESWSADHSTVTPLWFDEPADGKNFETLWQTRGFPQYDEAFTLP